MDRGQFEERLLEAYRGERAALVTLDCLIEEGLAGSDKVLAELFRSVEQLVGDSLEPLVRRRGLPTDIDRSRSEDARSRARRLGTWHAVVGSLGAALEPHVREFQLLRDAAPTYERPALSLLVDHEVALMGFGSLLLEDKVAEAELALREFIADYV